MHRLAAVLALILPVVAQRGTGELRLTVVDPSGLALEVSGSLTSESAHVQESFRTNADGQYTRKALPFGNYRLNVVRPGFSPFSTVLDVHSEVPFKYLVTLSVAPVETSLTIKEEPTVLDPERTGSANYVGAEAIRNRTFSLPGRSVIDLVNTQPGWVLEANGILHPRGSEYGVQYVVDGVPLFDNRSPAFAQSLGAEEFESMRVLTGGYPAEYGRKLGGVVEVTTDRDARPGFHGKAVIEGGSFGTVNSYVSAHVVHGGTTVGVSGEALETDRYLDPPVEQNYTNRGSAGGFSASLERDWTDGDRTRFYVTRHHTGFLVPNEAIQQEAGQREDRTADETSAQVSHEHVFSARLLGSIRALARDTAVRLWSNALATPIVPSQDRGFRQAYAAGSLSAHMGRHEWKAGGEAIYTSLRENFSSDIVTYRIAGMRIFDRDLPRSFRFSGRGLDREQSVFVQDLMRAGAFTASVGVRYDRYDLRASEHAVSPRLAVAWYIPAAGVVLRASYDRVFQTPATENILLASSDLLSRLGGSGLFLPLRSSRGNFYETGFSKSLFGKIRLDGSWYRRAMRNFADDDVLLNTGVSFPIAFAEGTIHGFEAKIDVARWGPISGFVSYGNTVGRGELPIAGGLFLGDEVTALAVSRGSFPISQDQRNTVRARIRTELGSIAWLAAGAHYDSGLPVELDDAVDRQVLIEQYGPGVVSRVNFDRHRVRPSYAIDVSGGVTVWQRERKSVTLQADVLNVTNHLNVINFASLFSGTAIDPGRSAGVRLHVEF